MKQSKELPPQIIKPKSKFKNLKDDTQTFLNGIAPVKGSFIKNSSLPLSINVTLISKSAEVIRALKHNLRRRILSFIHSKESTCVTEIYVSLGLTQSDASQHLRVLRNVGVVQTQRVQKQVFYSINYDRLKRIGLHIKNFVE